MHRNVKVLREFLQQKLNITKTDFKKANRTKWNAETRRSKVTETVEQQLAEIDSMRDEVATEMEIEAFHRAQLTNMASEKQIPEIIPFNLHSAALVLFCYPGSRRTLGP